MTDDDIKRLRELAQAATPGPRAVVPGFYSCINELTGLSFEIRVVMAASDLTQDDYRMRDADLRYIAAASPDAILALIDRLEAAERARCVAVCDGLAEQGAEQTTECTTCGAIVVGVAEPSEPIASVTGVHAGRTVVEPLNRALVLPVGMALYAHPAPTEPTAPSAEPSEPVAWMSPDGRVMAAADRDYWLLSGPTVGRDVALLYDTPLYAHPAPAAPTGACVEAMRMAHDTLHEARALLPESDVGHKQIGDAMEALRAQIERIGGGR